MFTHLSELLSPTADASFLKEILGKCFLHVEGKPDKFHELMSWKDLNSLMTFAASGSLRIRLIKGDQELESELYSRRGFNGYSQLLVAEVQGYLRDGAILAIEAVHELCEPISQLCRLLESALEVPVQVDVYASWFCQSGRTPRRDDNETIVLQVQGKKVWRLFRPVGPYRVIPDQALESTQAPSWDGVLNAGDLLYFPKGWWHSDVSTEEAALYLAITFKNPTGLDVVYRLVDRLDAFEIMHMDYPRFGTPESQSAFLTAIQKDIACACATPGLLLGLLKDIRTFSEPRIAFALPWIATPDSVSKFENGIITPLIRFPRADTIRHLEREDGVEIFHAGRWIRFEESANKVLRQIYNYSEPTIQKVIELCADEVPREQVLRILSQLSQHGILSVCAAS